MQECMVILINVLMEIVSQRASVHVFLLFGSIEDLSLLCTFHTFYAGTIFQFVMIFLTFFFE